MNEIERAREIYLTDVDAEDYADNKAVIEEWEHDLTHNEAYADWQAHDITRTISTRARELYREASLTLAQNRELTDQKRHSLWAKQDAALWLLSLTEYDAKGALAQLRADIRSKLNAT